MINRESCIRRHLRTLPALTLLLCWGPQAPAQDATGRIVGVVADPSSSAVPRARIVATNVETHSTSEAFSRDDGTYQIPLLPIGMYTISAEAQGFRKTLTSPQKLDINQALRVDLKLEIGATSETVQVEANAARVETVNATLGAAVTASQIVNAPLNGRNVLDLALLGPGVIPNTTSTGASNATFGFSVAGSRGDSVTYLLDGGVNNNLLSNGIVFNPNPDTIEEFRILTNNYTAEFGRSGGGIVSVVTKSGTNQLHGSAYDYVRNDKFNANRFFNNSNALPRDVLKRNQFGVTLGGPVVLPHVVNGKDRFFFFFAYQGQREASLVATPKLTVFTPAELNGDFSRSNSARNGPDQNVVNYLRKFPYFQSSPTLASQGIIDPTRISTVSRNFIKNNLIPSSSTGDLTAQASAKDDKNEFTWKPELHVTSKDRLAFTFGVNRYPRLTPFQNTTLSPPGYPHTTTVNSYYGTASYTRTFSATLLNDFRFTAQRNNSLQSVPAASLPNSNALGIDIVSDHPTGPPLLDFNSGVRTGFSPQGPTNLIDNTYTWSDTLTWIKGRHTMKTGLTYTPYQNNTVFDFFINGQFFFYGASGSSFSGNDHADFLMGLPDEYQQYPEAPSNIRQHNIGWFVQDEWRVRRNLTVTLGMRYEYSTPKVDLQNRSFSLGFGQQSQVFTKAPRGLLFPGDPGAPVGANFPDKNDWSPRFGFAWDPQGNGRMSIRGGFGVFYDVLKAEDNLQFNGQAPFFGFADLLPKALSANPTTEPNYFSQPFVATGQPSPFPSKPPAKDLDFAKAGFLPAGGGGVYFVDPNLRTPYIYQYNLSVQRDLGRSTTLEVSYAGSSSHKLTSLYDSNPMVLGTTQRVFNTQSGLPAASSFSYLDTFANVGSGNYNGLITSLSKRTSQVRYLGSLQFQLSYTYSKSIDNVSGFRARGITRVPRYNWNLFRGPSDFDLTHVAAFSAVWDLPFQQAWSRGPKRLTGGWRLYPIVSYRSGPALDVTAQISRTNARTGPSGYGDPNLVRANLVSQIQFFDPHNAQRASNGRVGNFYFEPAAFERASLVALQNNTNPALSTYGNLGRNAFRGPDRTNVNLTLGKVTDLYGERAKLEIRADFFNLLNNAQWNNPNITITSGTFGQISATADPRIIQLSARFTF